MSGELTATLTEQQRLLVHLIVHDGKGTQEAGALAGYKSNSVYSALKRPAVAAAISEAIQLDLAAVGAPLAYRVAKSLLQDKSVSPRVRADLSMKVLDRAGHIVPTRKGAADSLQKPLSEMSRDELAAFIDRNQAEIDKAEAEAASRARDVSPQQSPTVDAKSLSFLD
ncbi:hypothetical protein [Bradyrhizobium neotropicale]|uniref:hypothetical protein n=1 Tax=Bradyrhizobium neotropicale TaxID=1497615 RepID=UPI001AD7B386|nr:hypothetical protein [Bradyrhizobium neotropicale]MBO4228027.1 hypothetical protein [Bradyrhizobium neotropicale]